MGDIRRILITAYCQTPGLASAIRLLFPGVEVYTRAALAKKDVKADDVAELLRQLDVWVNIEEGDDFFAGAQFAAGAPNLRYISIPLIEFAAFHPDLCQARHGDKKVDYTSAIAVWAYRNGLPPAEAAKLYTRVTFARLGYLSEWNRSAARLQELFRASSLADDFDRFFRHIKRLGVFMYTATHPRSAVLAQLAKLIALRLGRKEPDINVDLPALDALSYFIWPIYPEIAENFSLPSSGYVWKFSDAERIRGLEPFITHSYRQYQTAGIKPADITIPGVDLVRIGHAVTAS